MSELYITAAWITDGTQPWLLESICSKWMHIDEIIVVFANNMVVPDAFDQNDYGRFQHDFDIIATVSKWGKPVRCAFALTATTLAEARNEYMKIMNPRTTHYFTTAVDEVYGIELNNIREIFSNTPEVDYYSFREVFYWHDLEHINTNFSAPQTRIFKYFPELHYEDRTVKGFELLVDGEGNEVNSTPGYRELRLKIPKYHLNSLTVNLERVGKFSGREYSLRKMMRYYLYDGNKYNNELELRQDALKHALFCDPRTVDGVIEYRHVPWPLDPEKLRKFIADRENSSYGE